MGRHWVANRPSPARYDQTPLISKNATQMPTICVRPLLQTATSWVVGERVFCSPWDGILRTASGRLYSTAGHTNPAVALVGPVGTPHTGMGQAGHGLRRPTPLAKTLQESTAGRRSRSPIAAIVE